MKKIFYSMLMLAMAAMTFTSCEDVPEPYTWPTPPESNVEEEVVTPQGSGTLEDPYNVAAAQALIQSLGADVQSEEIYVKGFISQIDDISPVPETTYGNATYWISDQKGSTAGQLEIYRGYSLGGEKFTSKDEIKEDDEVIVRISREDHHAESMLTLVGYDPYVVYDREDVTEASIDEPYAEEDIYVNPKAII